MADRLAYPPDHVIPIRRAVQSRSTRRKSANARQRHERTSVGGQAVTPSFGLLDLAPSPGMGDFEVVVGAGTLCSTSADAVRFPHRWTDEGVTVDAAFTGAHLLHLAAAGCVLNDVYREARGLNVAVNGVRVTASGGFDTDTWESTGIGYFVEIDSDSSADDVDAVLAAVDSVAEIPKSIRAGATVVRVGGQRASALPPHAAPASG